MKSKTRFTIALVAALLLCTAGAWAQGTGAITGLVTDPSGAVVAKAKVELANSATGAKREAYTSDAGIYRFSALPVVGTYTLRLEIAGFKTVTISDIVVSVGLTVTEDLKLELGKATETVVVEAGSTLTETSESQLSSLVDMRLWQSLPLEIRDQNTFINILPGVVPSDFTASGRGAAVNGVRAGAGNFLVEGYDNNDQGQGGSGAFNAAGAITSLSPDAIQEYRVLSNSYNAEYGKGGGFVTDTVLRSGTNQFHGSLFWYNRIQKLAANDFFSNAAGQKDRLVRNQYGGSLGGPVFKDRTFFYATWEGHKRRSVAPVTGTGTTQEFLDFVTTGAFRTFMETNANGICVVYTTLPCPGQFSANITALGPKFLALRALPGQNFPLSPTAGLPSCAVDSNNCVSQGGNSFGLTYPVHIYGPVTVPSRTSFNDDRVSLKMDHKLGEKDQISGTWLFEKENFTNDTGGSDTTIGAPFLNDGMSEVLGITWTHTFTPTTLNQLKASYLRHRSDFPDAAGYEGIPSVVTGFDPISVGFGNASNLPQFFTENQFQYQDHLSMTRGKHNIKMGGEFRRIRNGSAFEAWKNGLFLPYGIEELVTDGFWGDEADAITGYGYGAFFYAQASVNPTVPGTKPDYYRGYRSNEAAMYIQNDYRIFPRLTINMGLRWEYFGPPANFRKGLDSNFYFGSGVTPITPTANVFFPSTSQFAARIRNGAFQQRDHDIWNKDLNNFAPRVGFAYDMFGTGKMVLRGGFGMFYDRLFNNVFENIRFNPPFFANPQLGPLFSGTAVGPISSPGVYTVPFTSTGSFTIPGAPSSPRHMDQNLVTAYTEQWHLTTQYEFWKDYVVEVSYVGTKGNKLTGVIEANTFDGRRRGGSSTRINTNIATDNFRTNAFNSIFHSAQVSLKKNFSHGLQFNTNYTWGKTIDILSDLFVGKGGSFRPTDNANLRLDRGRADFDIRQRWVTTLFYDLPFFKQNRWLGGWSVSTIFTMQTGTPMPIFDGNINSGTCLIGGVPTACLGDPNADGTGSDRPVFLQTGNPNNIVNHNVSPADGYLAPFAAGVNPNFRRFKADGSDCATFGTGGVFISATRWWCNSNMGRNVITGPSFVNADFSVSKKFKITERIALQMQANFFNIFNHPNFQTPTGNINDQSHFGKSQSDLGPRVTQIAIRIDF